MRPPEDDKHVDWLDTLGMDASDLEAAKQAQEVDETAVADEPANPERTFLL